ncbi:helix-turn-helix domain-containing protein [Caulobacter segnis]
MHQSQILSTKGATPGLANALSLAVFAPTPREALLPWQAKRVRDYIDTGLHGRVSLSEAAGHARLSPGYFSRCFRQSFGVTFTRFVARRRIDRAQGLMTGGAAKLCHIALACGFADQAHFTRTFASLTGCTPARWRRQTAPALGLG